MDKTAIVTGGAGFIGSHLCELLLSKSHKVIVVDDLSTGRLSNIEHLFSSTNFKFIQGSVCDEDIMRDVIADGDYVYHLAAAVGVNLIVEKPVHTIETNIHGTEVVLSAANQFDKRVLIASTSEVYGKNEQVPFHEDDDTVLGSTKFSRWSYACSKAIDEFLALAYHRQYNLSVVLVRLFNTIGPRQTGRYGMVVPRFVEWALNNEPLMIYGSGKQSRSFTCVTDVITAMTALMNNEKANGEVYNIGSKEEITIEALADKVITKIGSKSMKKYIPYSEAYGQGFDDMQRRLPCLKKINQAIGYQPKVNLDQMLDQIIADKRVNHE
ncbi:MAG: nucleoside-diphosphate sugar epimerase [Planctomycetes bacterium GWF2_41_51]|nr:MAG: nucleoside-diphosphate sugar epimerase [Planctomycetes bacterium GWF2_41_51]